MADAANATGAHVVLLSTDWVFDGTQGPAREDAPPNPVNQYGFLKAASELVLLERAERGTVARVAGVQGIHRARPRAPRGQDHGFGYLVASLVEALRADRPFTVWESPAINTLATPTLATGAAELILLALEREVTGVLHCCGGEHVDRVGLARRRGRGVRPRSRPRAHRPSAGAARHAGAVRHAPRRHRHGGRARRRAPRP